MAFPVSPTNGQITVVNNITYQFSNVGNTWTRILSTANIITANTLVSNGYISAAGNVSGNYILGNGSQLTGISINPSNIASGTSNVKIVSAGGNATVNIGGTANVAVFATTGEYITGVLSASGNVTGGNILTAGSISSTGTLSVTGATTLGTASTGNLSSGNISTGGIVSATANVVGGNILTGGIISAASTITGSQFNGSGAGLTSIPGANVTGTLSIPTTSYAATVSGNAQANITSVGTLTSLAVTADVTGGNLLTGGLISATSTITSAANITGGNLLTGGLVSATANVVGGNILTGGNLTLGNVNAFSSNSVIQGWSYSNVALSITAAETLPAGLFFGNAGSSFYVVGTTNDRVLQYNMSSTNMANTGVLFGNVIVSGQDTAPNDLFIDSTGANMYMLGQTNRVVYQYTMPTPWNITTATYATLSANVSAQEATPTGLWFKPDLTTMYVVGSTNNTVYQYTLSTPGNVATAAYASKSFNVTAGGGGGGGTGAVNLSSDGAKMWTIASAVPSIAEYNLATPWDVSTASYVLGNTVGILAQEGLPTGMFVDLANSRAWIVGSSNDTVYQYNTANSIILTANAVGIRGQLNVQGNAWFGQQVQFGNSVRAENTLTVDSAFSAGSTITMSTTTGTIGIGTSQTTGTTVIGSATQTGTITLGQSTATQSVLIANASTTSGNTKTVNIAGGGVANSVSNVTIFGGVAGNSTLAIGASTGNTTVSYTGNTVVAIANTSGSALSVAGNITGGNLLTGGLVSATANVTGGNLLTAGLISATSTITSAANVTGGNVLTAGQISATGTITSNGAVNGTAFAVGNSAVSNVALGMFPTAGTSGEYAIRDYSNVATNLYLDVGMGGTANGAFQFRTSNAFRQLANINSIGITTPLAVSATGNVTGNYFIGNGSQLTGVTATTTSIVNGTSNVVVAASGNVTVGVAGTATVATFTTAGIVSNSVATTNNGNAFNFKVGDDAWLGDINIADTIGIRGQQNAANGYIVFGNADSTSTLGRSGSGPLTYAGAFSATSNITGGNVLTGGLISSTGTITGSSHLGAVVSVTANVTGGNLLSAAIVSAVSNITGGNLLTAGLISATGNITGGNVNTSALRPLSGALTISTVAGNLNLSPTTGNIVVNSTYINGVVDPVQDQDVATKKYVDNFATTAITYHQAVNVATTTTLATTTGGTITYTQPNGASNGVGALLTTTGSFNLVDTANVQTLGTRILVKNEANAVFNGVYTWANATNIVRSTDTDEYGANSVTQISLNDYFFVTSGNVNAGSAYIVDAPSGTITFGTSNITFAQFSSSQVYTANTSAGISIAGTVINAKVDGTTTAFDGSGNISVKASANLTTPNIGAATGTSLSTTANVTGGNLLTAGLISSTGTITGSSHLGTVVSVTANVTGGNLLTSGLITATGNITGGNLLNNGLISSTGNSTAANYLTSGLVTATGNITGGNILTAGILTATGNIISVANVSGGNLITSGIVTATGNITGGNILTAGLVSATSTITSAANITGGNILTSGLVSATGTVTGSSHLGAVVSVTANVTGGNILTGGLVSATANITGGNIITAGLITASGNVNVLANVNIGNANSVSWANATGIRAYTYYNNSTTSLDTVFL